MWKRYLTFALAVMLVFHTVAVPVYAEGETGSAQSGIVDPETEEEAGSEGADDSKDKGEPDAGQNEEAEPEQSEQPEQEETGENEGEKQPEESAEKGEEQTIEDAGEEKPGENEGEDAEETGEKDPEEKGDQESAGAGEEKPGEDAAETSEKDPEDNEGEEPEKADEVNLEEDGEENLKETEEMDPVGLGKEEKIELEGVYQFGDAPSDSEGIELFSFEYSKDMDIAEVEAYIYRQLKVRRAKIVIENYHDEFSASDVISSLLNKHPDLYYVRKGFYESVSYVDYTLTLRMTYDNTMDDKAFSLATERALAGIRPGMSDLEKAVVLHDYLAVNCEYDHENYEAGTIPAISYTAYGVLVNRTAVCQGYALAYKYLLNEAGIKCYMVTGRLMNHAWNLIELDGAFYHVDVTWADPVFDLVGRVQHQYMFRSDQAYMNPDNSVMEKHYLWDVTEGNQVVNYKATDTRYDNAFWKNCYSSLILEGADCYYISSDHRIKKASLAEPSAEGIDIGGAGTYTEPGQDSGLFMLSGRLYYNTKTSICSIGLSGDDGRTEFNGDGSKGYLYGCAFAQGRVLYAQGYKTNFQKVPAWTLEVEELSALVPVESITLNHEKLVLKIGETALLEAVVSPNNAPESGVIWLNSNEAAVSMENGKVTALEAGICIITAVAGDKEAVCQVTVTDMGNEERIAGGRYKNIVWEINMDGKLRVEGTGEFSDSNEIGRAPWSDFGRSILSAEIKVANLKNASYMFSDCTELASLDIRNFDTSCVTDMKYMFRNCCSLKTLDLSSFDTAQVTNMGYMFYWCTDLKDLNVSGFDTRNVNYMTSMFEKCSNLESLDLSNFNTGNVAYMSSMFYHCESLVSLDLSSFDTSGVVNMGYLFGHCENLKSLDLSSFDTSSMTTSGYIFYGCKSLAVLDLSNFDTSKVTYSGCELTGCDSLEKIYTPYNLTQSIVLPGAKGDIWYQPDGAKITELPKNLGYSIMITKNQIPIIEKAYLSVTKRKTAYSCGDVLNIDDLNVKYHGSDGTVKQVTDYITNEDKIDMSTPGTKTLVVTYQNLSAEIKMIVTEKQAEVTPETKGFKITFQNEQDKKSVYTGSAIKPEIKVSYNGRSLAEGTNYTLKYANNVRVGNAKITVTGKGSFKSSKTENFEIVQADIANAELAGTDEEGRLVVVSGSKFAPAIYHGNLKLTKKDYSIGGVVSAGQKIAGGDAGRTVSIKGKGNYTGTKEIILRVVKKSDLVKFTVTLDKTKLNALIYDGSRHYIHDIQGALTVTGKDGNTNMKYGTDYTTVYPANVIDTGAKKFTVIGMGLYTGTVRKSYTIKPAAGTNGTMKAAYESDNIENIKLPYRSTGVTFNDQLKVTYTQNGDTMTLREGKDYKVTYRGNKKIGSNAKFTISFLGNYKGIPKQTRTFTIEKADLEKADIVIADAVYKNKPGIYKSAPYVIEQETGRLIKASNYTVTYYVDENRNIEMKGKNKVSSGDTVYVKIEAKANSNYKSDKAVVKTYQVANAIDLSKAKLSFVSAETGTATKYAEYTGQKITDREIKVLVNGKPADADMIVTYANNIDKGKATVIITGTGKPECRYTGCKKATFNIVAYNLR